MRRSTAELLVGLAVSTLLVVLLPAIPAWAAPCTGASVIHVQAVPDTNGRGARSTDMETFNPTVQCVHISSIGDRSTSTDAFVEAGWLENPEGLIVCVGSTSGQPKWFTFFVRINGTYNCASGGSLNGGDFHSYSVKDPNLDGNWMLSFDGDPKQTPDLGAFTTGQPIANGERRVSEDPGHVNIKHLDRMDATSSWVNWQGTYVVADNDTTYDACTDLFP